MLVNVGQEVDEGVKGLDDGVEGNSCIESISSVGVIALSTLVGLRCCSINDILSLLGNYIANGMFIYGFQSNQKISTFSFFFILMCRL